MIVAVSAVQVRVPGHEVRALGRSRLVRDRRFSPGVIHVTHKQRACRAAVDPRDVPLQVLPVEVQIASADAHPHRGARCVIIIPDVRRARLLELHQAPFQRVPRRHPVHGLRGPVSFRVITVSDRVRSVRGTGELPSLLPGEAPVVIVVRGVPDRVIGDRVSVIGRQLVLPVGVTIRIALYRRSGPRKGVPCLVSVLLCLRKVPATVVAVDDGLAEVCVVLPDQLV